MKKQSGLKKVTDASPKTPKPVSGGGKGDLMAELLAKKNTMLKPVGGSPVKDPSSASRKPKPMNMMDELNSKLMRRRVADN